RNDPRGERPVNESVLVVDDEKLIRWSLRECLTDAGYEVSEAEDGGSALRLLEQRSFDLLLLDFRLPDLDGIEILERLQTSAPGLPVIMITAHSSVDHAVRAVHAGANDYVAKPFRNEDILLRVSKALENERLKLEVSRLRTEQQSRLQSDRMIGSSPAMQKVLGLAERVAGSGSATVLIQGPSGTGKDVLAKSIHTAGARSDQPYLNITCTAIPESLLESELFGHEKGAFTDARSQKKGLLEQANGGTVFLDEIGDMSPYLQGKILRFLEEKTFRRVGGDRDIRVDVRVVAATNKDLKKLVAADKFREDLYFRLKVIPIAIPPLTERREDIPALVTHFIQRFNRELNRSVVGTSDAFLKHLEEYHWPGNIRELKNTIERAMILSTEDVLDERNLPIDLFDETEGRETSGDRIELSQRGLVLEDVERDLVRQALTLAKGNQTRAGRLLGLNRDQIRYRVEKFSLQELLPHED
ncbi:MAG: sigma-54 dependent transcriptional regulator, partial [Planctomycetota bacterium]